MWIALGLEHTNLDGSAFYFEKSLGPKIGAVQEIYRQFSSNRVVCQKQASAFLAKADAAVRELNDLIGGASMPDTPAEQKAYLENTMKLVSAAVKGETPITYCLVTRAATKDYLRTGGTLPGFSYDGSSDTVHYDIKFQQTIENSVLKASSMPDPQVWVLPVGGLDTVEADLQDIFSRMLSAVELAPAMALHELAEARLIQRLRPSVPHYRWFDEGVANALAIRLARRYASDGAARLFTEALRTEPFA